MHPGQHEEPRADLRLGDPLTATVIPRCGKNHVHKEQWIRINTQQFAFPHLKFAKICLTAPSVLSTLHGTIDKNVAKYTTNTPRSLRYKPEVAESIPESVNEIFR